MAWIRLRVGICEALELGARFVVQLGEYDPGGDQKVALLVGLATLGEPAARDPDDLPVLGVGPDAELHLPVQGWHGDLGP
jgi:hypothetical protein